MNVKNTMQHTFTGVFGLSQVDLTSRATVFLFILSVTKTGS